MPEGDDIPPATPASTSTDSSDSRCSGRDARRTARDRRDRRGRNQGRRNANKTFKGDTAEMNGHVFESFEECRDPKQFNKTVEALAAYSAKTHKYAGDMASVFKDFKTPVVPRPSQLTKSEKEDDVAVAVWKKNVETYATRLTYLEGNLKAMYAVTWGQCSEAVKSKIMTASEYEDHREESDLAWLLQEIRGVVHGFQTQRTLELSFLEALIDLLTYKQGPKETLADYLQSFRTKLGVLEHYGGGPVLGQVKALIARVRQDHRLLDPDALGLKTSERCEGIVFLMNADKARYGTLLSDLENQNLLGKNNFPTDLPSAYAMLVGYKQPSRSAAAPTSNTNTRATHDNDESIGMQFAQAGDDDAVPGSDGILHSNITCYKCHDKGHFANKCPGIDSQFLQFTFAQAQARYRGIPENWVLLDSESTISCFKTKKFLSNIRRSTKPVRVLTNGGPQVSRLEGDIPNLGAVYFNPNSLANILSLAQVRRVCRVTMDSAVEAAMVVHRSDGTTIKFVEHWNGLYYHDAAGNDITSAPVVDYSFLTTVAQNKAKFTAREIEGADKARALYRKLGRPSQQAFEKLLASNGILNCPITADDARRAAIIYGPDVASLKGKTTNKASDHVPSRPLIPVPAHVMEHHRDVTLCADLFYVQGEVFYHTISRKIQLRTVAHIKNREGPTLARETKAVIKRYESRSFRVTTLHADGEFEKIRSDILPVELNVTAADDHVKEAERSVRTMKERTRCTIQGLPYRRYPKLMVKHIVIDADRCLNSFPAKNGVSDTLSPRTIVCGVPNPDYNKLKLELGAYVQVFEDNSPVPGTNTTATRTTGAIALTATGNEQGDYYFMSLTTGRQLSRRQWTELPITQEVVKRVEALAKKEGQPVIRGGNFEFEWEPRVPIEDEEEDDEEPDDSGDEGATEAVAPAVTIDDDDGTASTASDDQHEDDDSVRETSDDEADEEDETPVEAHSDVEDSPSDDEADDEAHAMDEGAHDDGTLSEHEGADDGATAGPDGGENHDGGSDSSGGDAITHSYDLRPERPRDYSHLYGNDAFQFFQHAVENVADDPFTSRHDITGYLFTQMSATAGIKKHGQVAIDALFKEFAQLHDKNVFEAMNADSLTGSQKRKALRAINVIKEKRCGKIKGRTCADGRPQRSLYRKDETTSPTVSTDALLISIMIDALEQRDVATADIVGAYLNADMDDFVLLRLTGNAVDILCSVSHEYKAFVTHEGNTKVLYVRLAKALYGCVKSALLWYELFVGTLKEHGFELNPYDPCVANCNIRGKQCTVAWFVDDNKISHVDPKVVDEVIQVIESKFGKMTVTRGKRHTFLGMDITYNKDGTATIFMKDYIREAIADFPDNVSSKTVSPAGRGLFDVDENSPKLDEARKETFHSITAKLLYVSQRARSDIAPTIAFLCTRVSRSTEQDWLKLRRLLQYLNNSIDEPCILGADNLSSLMTWVDASYAVHADMKSHTGGALSLGRGAIMCKSTKQKLNTKSSTEAETVGASDYLPNTIWARMFLEAQGYGITNNVFAQDNESAIRLEQNGRASAGQKSRHIDIRHFFITDRIKSERLAVVHCPTVEMLADFFTKPLQGALFRKFRAIILGHEPIAALQDSLDKYRDTASLPQDVSRETNSSSSLSATPTEERVGKVRFNLHSAVDEQTSQKKGRQERRTYADTVKSGRLAEAGKPAKSRNGKIGAGGKG